MKKLTLFFLCGIAFACNSGSTTSTNTTSDSTGTDTSTAAMNYPYTIDHPDYWQIGSSANTMTILSALKAWEQGNMDESVKYFADSVLIELDGPAAKISNDSLKAMFNAGKSSMKSVKIDMKDWESVISKDKKEEWVTIWYTQHEETNAGKVDSAAIIDDAQLKDGKIIRLAEYKRKL
jgi:hypothetical protein